ncbi:MAG TPA: hypothetical protein VHB01_03865 [Nitrosospira sp.]|nr:hypothetical protein [Nitrosospira sp.]
MDSIFNMFEVAGHKEQPKEDIRAKEDFRTAELANAFHKIDKAVSPQIPGDKEPDWSYLIRNAKSTREKFEVMSAHDAYKAEQKYKVIEQQKAQFEQKVNDVFNLSQHVRNKAFYEELQQNSPSVYFDTRIQKQKKRDREVMGLTFHLRNK